METIQTKCCSKCGVEKPLTREFFLFRKDSNRYRAECHQCRKIINDEYRSKPEVIERKKELSKIYRLKPEVKERKKQYSKKPEYIEWQKEYQKKYFSNKENKERKKNYKKEWHSKTENKARRNKINRERYNTDIEYKFTVSIMGHIRGVEKRAEFKQEWDDVKDIYEMYGIDYHIDHKVPKNWFKSTTPKDIVNDLRNLQVIDSVYNLSKQDRWSDPICNEYKEMILPYIKNQYLKSL